MNENELARLIAFVQQLQENGISFSLGSVRDAIMVTIPLPDRYLEVEFFADGHIEVESFGPPASDVVEFTSHELLAAVISHLDAADTPSPLELKFGQ